MGALSGIWKFEWRRYRENVHTIGGIGFGAHDAARTAIWRILKGTLSRLLAVSRGCHGVEGRQLPVTMS